MYKWNKTRADLSDREQRIFDFLDGHPVGVLSTVTPDGEPHGVTIYYSVNPRFIASFITRSETRKHDNMQHNNHVMLTVFDAETQTTVQITGRAVAQNSSYEMNRTAGAIAGSSMKTSRAGLLPISKLEAGSYVGYNIEPLQVRMAVYARPDKGEYSDIFESIESFDLEAV